MAAVLHHVSTSSAQRGAFWHHSNTLFLPRFAASAIRVNVDDESLQDKQMFDVMLCVVQVAAVGVVGLKYVCCKGVGGGDQGGLGQGQGERLRGGGGGGAQAARPRAVQQGRDAGEGHQHLD